MGAAATSIGTSRGTNSSELTDTNGGRHDHSKPWLIRTSFAPIDTIVVQRVFPNDIMVFRCGSVKDISPVCMNELTNYLITTGTCVQRGTVWYLVKQFTVKNRNQAWKDPGADRVELARPMGFGAPSSGCLVVRCRLRWS